MFGDQALFGPVVIDPPSGEAAVRLWHAVTGWLEFPHLYEIQRPKRPTDIAAIAETFRPYFDARDWESHTERDTLMPTIVDKDATVAVLAFHLVGHRRALRRIRRGRRQRPTCLPGWTVRDQLSHLTGTEEMLAGLPTPDVDVSHLAHLRNDIARANEAWIESRRALPGAEVLTAFRASHPAAPRHATRHDPTGLRAPVLDAGRARRNLRPLHADPGVRLVPP